MLDKLIALDKQLFLFLNGIHYSFLDGVMLQFSGLWMWMPLFVFLLWILIKDYKKDIIWIFLFVILLITITDKTSVYAFKNVFHRLRPCHEPALAPMIHLLKDCGGQYGFVSSHAINSFAISLFIITIFRTYRSVIIIFMIVYASLASYSRIYIGVHYPGDVICGGIIGALIGYIIGRFFIHFESKYSFYKLKKH
ncbi:MAG: phosphatase PAP2 family protein [Bacteroidota bacterium]|nr:phosphatase PAP2 family protein [Bacteroidota bacterium]